MIKIRSPNVFTNDTILVSWREILVYPPSIEKSEVNNRTASLKPVGIRGFANGHFSGVEAPHAVILKLESGSCRDTRYTTVLCVFEVVGGHGMQ